MNFEKKNFHFYFSNNDFLFTINSSRTKFCIVMKNIHMQGNVSQNFDLGFW